MTHRTARFLRVPPVWLAVAFALVLVLMTWIGNRPRFILGFEGGPLADVMWLSFAGLIVGLVVVGAVIVTRVPGNRVGWVLVLTGLLHGSTGALLGYAYWALVLAWPLPGGTVANWVGSWSAVPAGVVTGLIFLLFPDGRLPTPRWRWPARLYVATGTVFAVAAAIDAWPRRADGDLDLVEALPFLGEGAHVWAAFMLTHTLPLAALAVRYRRGRPDERAQIRWLVSAGVVVVTGQLAMGIAGTSLAAGAVAAVSTITIPAAIGVAILRYRLYAIDRIISRTVTYGLVLAVLGAVYAVGVVTLGATLSGVSGRQGSDLAVAASTLAAIALFRPVRSRVQAVVDRRFNRTGYDARRAVEAFTDRVRDEVELDAIQQQAIIAAAGAVQPAHASVWLVGSDRAAGRTERRA